MTIPSGGWDETKPAGTRQINLGDDDIRELKAQVREVIDIDHQLNSAGVDVDNGKHKKVSMLVQSDIGIGASGTAILGLQGTAGSAELVFTDENDNDVQITSGGTLKPSTDTTLANWSAVMNLVYPVGSIVTLGVSTNPGVLYGVGTWTAIAGKVIVGIDASQTEFDTLDETGGSKTADISHTHNIGGTYADYWAQDNGLTHAAGVIPDDASSPIVTDSQSVSSISSLQPYIVKYVWQRTA